MKLLGGGSGELIVLYWETTLNTVRKKIGRDCKVAALLQQNLSHGII